jgi:hypothetical protein
MRNKDTADQWRRRSRVVFVRNIGVTLFVFGAVAYNVANEFKTIGNGKQNDIPSLTTSIDPVEHVYSGLSFVVLC